MWKISTIILLIILFLPLESISQAVIISPNIEKRDSIKYLIQKIAQKDTDFREKRESVNTLLLHLNSEAIVETYGVNGTLLNAMEIKDFLKRLKYGEYGEPDDFEISIESDKEVTLRFVPVAGEEPAVEVIVEEPQKEVEITPRKKQNKRKRSNRTEDIDITIGEPEVEIEISKAKKRLQELRARKAQIEQEMQQLKQPELEGEELIAMLEPISRKRRNRRDNTETEIPIKEPETPEVEIEVERQEITIEQPETPTIEIEVETPEEPALEIEVEIPENKRKERRRKNKEAGIPEVTISEPEAPEVAIEETEIEVVIKTLEKPVRSEKDAQFILTSIPYKNNTFRFTKEFYNEMDRLAETMRKFPNLSITIESYFDDNIRPKIVDQRAYYIQNYLVNKGIEPNRIQINFSYYPDNTNSISIIGFATTLKYDILNFYNLLKIN